MYGYLALVPLALSALSQVAALSPRTPRVLKRQSIDPSDFPPACQSVCTPIANALNNCTDLQCLCTNANGKSLEGCMDCSVGTTGGSTATAQAQQVLDQFTSECQADGISVSSFTVVPSTGAGGASGSATATRTGTATGSATGILTTASSALVTFSSAAAGTTTTGANTNTAVSFSLTSAPSAQSSSSPLNPNSNGALPSTFASAGVVLFAVVASSLTVFAL